jgi:tetratricopeptide (TPR) repeat protein
LTALKERLDAEALDREFLVKYEDVRLQEQSRVELGESRFTKEAAFPELQEALRRRGIKIGVTPPDRAAALVQDRPEPARRYLVAALHECFQRAPKGDVQARQWLVSVLNSADKDDWRVQVREVIGDGKALEQLAREVDVRQQPTDFLLLVVRCLPAHPKSNRLELLRRLQGAYPADLWTNHGLAFELMNDGRPAEAVRYYTAALALRPDNPGIYLNRGRALEEAGELDAAIADFRRSTELAPTYAAAHVDLGHALQAKGRRGEAIGEFREAIRIKPDLAAAHTNLGNALSDEGQLDEAIAEFREAVRLKNDHVTHYNLGSALKDKGRTDEAIAELREAIRIKPDFALPHNNLGLALQAKGKLDEAIAEYREGIRKDQDFAEAHGNLGRALIQKGQRDEAIAEFHEAIRIKPDLAGAYNELGMALYDKGRLDEAIAAYQAAIRIDPEFALPHNNLGNALRGKGQRDEAIAAYREAVRIDKDFALAYYHLGTALGLEGQCDEAIAAFREAIRIKNDYVDAHHNLGSVLVLQGRLDEGIAEYREVLRLLKDDPRGHAEVQANLRRAEELAELKRRLPAVLDGKDQPRDASESLGFAEVCQQPFQKQYADAAGFFAAAFAAEPRLAADLQAGHRYNAACAAALAGCGQGKDADQSDNKERARLRRQALEWLRADLAAYRRALDQEPDRAGPAVRERMQHWQQDKDFAGVRGPDALAKLPEAERQDWQQLWQEVEALRQRAAKP